MGRQQQQQGQEQVEVDRVVRRLAAVCLILGAVAIAGFRNLHGDLPAADPDAALRFITDHPFYAGVHLGTILGVLLWAGGMLTLAGTLGHPVAKVLGRLSAGSVLVGAAVFITDFSIDGVAGQDLAADWAAATPAARPDLELAAQTAFTILRGTSLTSIIVLWGLPLLLVGWVVLLERYPSWLGWSGLGLGAVTVLAAIALLLREDLFPGVLLYGLLISIVMPLWSMALGVVLWRRAAEIQRF